MKAFANNKPPGNHEPAGANKHPAAGHSHNQPPVITTGSLFSMRAFNAERDLPFVYSDKYNIFMAGLELLHQFDTKKYAKLAEHLSDEFVDTPYARHLHRHQHGEPASSAAAADDDEGGGGGGRRLRYLAPNRPVSSRELEIHHSVDYIAQLHTDKSLVARITEIWALNLVPMCAIEQRLLTPIKWQVAGTIFAFHLAMQHGWAINLGGGFHQGSANGGETFCLLSDICLAMKYVWRKHPLQKFMIVDLDAHQATGLERDLVELEPKHRKKVYMVDVFNNSIQPPDQRADKGIDLRMELGRFTGDETYLHQLEVALAGAFERFKPSMVIYVAGQDVLKNDQLGLMNLSDEGLKRRDEKVFSWATERHRCPIVMLLGGGYLVRGARVQADSIRNLFAKGLIWGGHRSGSRSLSRPRAPPAPMSKSSGTAPDAAAAAAAVQKQAPAAARIVKVAPIESKFMEMKLAAKDKDKK